MVDYHCHLLPDLDDGSRSLYESVFMAKQLVAAGFCTVYCTPHLIHGFYETKVEQVDQSVAQLQTMLDKEGVCLRLKTGMEYYVDEYLDTYLETAVPLEGTDLLLFEIPPACQSAAVILDSIRLIKNRGFRPLLAHPERCINPPPGWSPGLFRRKIHHLGADQMLVANLQDSPVTLADLIDCGCRLQGNIGSFAGVYGKPIRQYASVIANQGLYHCYGSDGHRINQLVQVLQGHAQVVQLINKYN